MPLQNKRALILTDEWWDTLSWPIITTRNKACRSTSMAAGIYSCSLKSCTLSCSDHFNCFICQTQVDWLGRSITIKQIIYSICGCWTAPAIFPHQQRFSYVKRTQPNKTLHIAKSQTFPMVSDTFRSKSKISMSFDVIVYGIHW